MTWEWSHTNEAYDNVRAQIYARPTEWLRECWAEIKARTVADDGCDEDGFNNLRYDNALVEAATLPDDTLADDIERFASEQRRCTNGGWRAHCCPWGCHDVPFDPVETETVESE